MTEELGKGIEKIRKYFLSEGIDITTLWEENECIYFIVNHEVSYDKISKVLLKTDIRLIHYNEELWSRNFSIKLNRLK